MAMMKVQKVGSRLPCHGKLPSVQMSQIASYLSTALSLSCVCLPLIEAVRFIHGLCVVRCRISPEWFLSVVELTS